MRRIRSKVLGADGQNSQSLVTEPTPLVTSDWKLLPEMVMIREGGRRRAMSRPPRAVVRQAVTPLAELQATR